MTICLLSGFKLLYTNQIYCLFLKIQITSLERFYVKAFHGDKEVKTWKTSTDRGDPYWVDSVWMEFPGNEIRSNRIKIGRDGQIKNQRIRITVVEVIFADQH